MLRNSSVTSYQKFLLLVFVGTWIWSMIRPDNPTDWVLENIAVLIFVVLILATARHFRLSSVSYTCIVVFTILHLIAAHHTYPEVPFGQWLGDLIGSDRNMYDRFVHFSFGLLCVYPVREIFLRLANVKGFWGYFFPINIVLSLSAVYEIFEWLVSFRIDETTRFAFLGMQGDVFDPHKDMALAGIGALITMIIVLWFNWKHDQTERMHIRESFHLPADDHPLGEDEFHKLWYRRKGQSS